LSGIALFLLLLPLRLKLRARQPETFAGRAGVLLTLLVLRILPVIVFLGAALLLLDQNETHKLARYVIINVIYAIALCSLIRQILRGIFAPATDHLRLLSFTTPQAVYGYRWFSAFSMVIVFGAFTVLIASALRVPLGAIVVFQNILGLVLVVMATVVILQTRLRVALIIRGKKAENDESFSHAVREGLAHRWHIFAIAYLVISFVITALGIDNGIALMLRGTILTFIILAVTRLSFVALDRWVSPQEGGMPLVHRQMLSFVIRPLIWVIAVIAAGASWGMHIRRFIATAPGERAFGAFISIALTLFFLTVVYEVLNTSIERHLNRRDRNSKLPVASARARTLLPMVRNSIFILFSGVAILTFLSAVGFNIGPVLAGAGVVGVAIGFGSQTLVKDFLTGLFIVVENTVAVGDVVKIGDFGGVVETLSIRTLRLRDSDGSLHILPFSQVTNITNMTRGYAYALVDVSVAYDNNLENVMTVLRDIGKGLQEDPIFKRVILEPIEVMGIENMGDAAITIRTRIRTRAGKQWDVRRLLLLRIHQRFEKENIGIPTTVTATQFAKAKAAAPAPKEKPIKMTTAGPAEPGT
jgi:small conductance mechanosensitive channel